ncbi:MAG: hypothetical protein ABIQ04_03100 [Candidatus Saccharimonadales bacterium]
MSLEMTLKAPESSEAEPVQTPLTYGEVENFRSTLEAESKASYDNLSKDVYGVQAEIKRRHGSNEPTGDLEAMLQDIENARTEAFILNRAIGLFNGRVSGGGGQNLEWKPVTNSSDSYSEGIFHAAQADAANRSAADRMENGLSDPHDAAEKYNRPDIAAELLSAEIQQSILENPDTIRAELNRDDK